MTISALCLIAFLSGLLPGEPVEEAAAESNAADRLSMGQKTPETATDEGLKLADDELRWLGRENNQFGINLYHELKGLSTNLFFSPFSIRTALTMTYAGARETTREQMRKALSMVMEDTQVHAAHEKAFEHLEEVGKGPVELSIANSVYALVGMQLQKDFVDIMNDSYSIAGSVQRLDFRGDPKGSRLVINEWVEKKTKDKIKELIPDGSITPLTRLVLVNAVYFLGTWLDQFDKEQTVPSNFHVSEDEKVPVDLMYRKGQYRYLRVSDAQILELPYKGESVSMLVVLPGEGVKLEDVESQISWKSLEDWTSKLEDRKVRVFLPRFKMTWGSKDIKESLSAIGMPTAFVPGKADFSGINGETGDSVERLAITYVFHKAFVEVNEEGTEAAAATAVVMEARGMAPKLPTFRADRPFVFMIRDNASGAILFMGRLVEPHFQ